ncbi:MAG: RHS repeat-associated core domain-containing protein [Bacteroidota bacterium]
MGHTSQYFWDDRGLVWKKVDAKGKESFQTFNEQYKLIKQSDELGAITHHDYDQFGNRVKTIYPDFSEQIFNYSNGKRVGFTNQIGNSWSWNYDKEGYLVQSSDPQSNTTNYSYNEGVLDEIEYSDGRRRKFEYDDSLNISKIISQNGKSIQLSYNSLGKVTEINYPGGDKEIRIYDLLGRIIKKVGSKGESSYFYNPEGKVIKRKNKDRIIENRYNNYGFLIAYGESGKIVECVYNTENKLEIIKNELGDKYHIIYDENSRVIEEISFDGIKRIFNRDEKGRVKSILRGNGVLSEYEYDILDRVVAVNYSNGEYERYQYRSDGFIEKASNNHSTIEFIRDPFGNVLEELQDDCRIISTYDNNGFRVKLESSLGYELAFIPKWGNDVASISISDSEVSKEIAFEYDKNGFEAKRIFQNGVQSEWRRDKNNLPSELNIYSEGNSSRQLSYFWDSRELLAELNDSRHGKASYQYNTFEALVKAEYENGEVEYRSNDFIGNIYKDLNGNDRVYGNSGQLIQSKVLVLEYDGDGHLIRKRQTDGGIWKYSWYASGLLKEVIDPNDERTRFTYDVLGRRISKSHGECTLRWVWDNNLPLHEWEEKIEFTSKDTIQFSTDSKDPSLFPQENNNQKVFDHTEVETKRFRTWVFRPSDGTIVGKLEGGKFYGVISNYMGTPISMYDDNGSLMWDLNCSVSGEIRNVYGDLNSCPFRKPGQYYDSETGLTYNRFRYYDSEVETYISPDPLRLMGGRNFYSYVSDPNKQFDYFGLIDCGPLGELPEGAVIIDQGDGYVVYETADGEQRIRFDAAEARTLQEANPGRNHTTDTLAGVTPDGKPFVHEGRHRAIGAARGDEIGTDLGGVEGHPGVLDYEYTSSPAPSGGREVRDLDIDYSEPDLSKDEADRAWEEKHGF